MDIEYTIDYLYHYDWQYIIDYYLFLVRLLELRVILPDATTVKVKVPVNDTVENVKKQIEVSSAL